MRGSGGIGLQAVMNETKRIISDALYIDYSPFVMDEIQEPGRPPFHMQALRENLRVRVRYRHKPTRSAAECVIKNVLPKILNFRRHMNRFQALRRDRPIFFNGIRRFCTGDSQPHTRIGGRLDSPFSIHSAASISAGLLSAGMVFTPEMALPASTLQIFKGGKQVQDQHRRVSQKRRVDERNRIVWAVDA